MHIRSQSEHEATSYAEVKKENCRTRFTTLGCLTQIKGTKRWSSSLLPLPKMPKGKKANGKKVALAPAVVKKQEAKKMVNPLFEKRSKNFDTRQDI